jgi:hypothetical protein
MKVQIGKFKAELKKNGLLLRHATGIGFELTPVECLGMLQFLQVHEQTLKTQRGTTDPETQPILRIIKDEDDQPDIPT